MGEERLVLYRKCSVCKIKRKKEDLFYAQLKPWCGDVECGTTLSIQLRAKETERKAKAEKKLFRERKSKLDDTVPKWTKKAQAEFNKYIRERDHGLPCISCERWEFEIEDCFTGGKWDCGHWKSVGSHPELRFEPLNAHRQCKSCNGGSGKYARKSRTVSQEYKERLKIRIGENNVKWLEGSHENKYYRVEDLKEIAAHYRKLTRELKKQREI